MAPLPTTLAYSPTPPVPPLAASTCALALAEVPVTATWKTSISSSSWALRPSANLTGRTLPGKYWMLRPRNAREASLALIAWASGSLDNAALIHRPRSSWRASATHPTTANGESLWPLSPPATRGTTIAPLLTSSTHLLNAPGLMTCPCLSGPPRSSQVEA
jgi:hypothetical protein